jgi:hypothetical protein
VSSTDPHDGCRTLAKVTDTVRTQGERRRARGAGDAVAAVLPDTVSTHERATLAKALQSLHELLVSDTR